MSLFYSATFPKAVNDKSDVKMEDLTSTAKIHRKQVYMCMSKNTTHSPVYRHARTHVPAHTRARTHTHSNAILDNFSVVVITYLLLRTNNCDGGVQKDCFTFFPISNSVQLHKLNIISMKDELSAILL